ncbi:TetR/AcrR family transcriptional regulator [Aldersonia sp. NBC_00410]|uniref:TetR/AcrR family transcriptional regulator n=1 Tax=Aldersonia sp. NBC_00410 TaxID=2975954 RepID=UPI00224E13D2|nr:TetR/AcrR family transcriptional regulator [Aldersonia sp. NBC_00410]MCX5043494.1 TetR/AcrR family transcriptional regulator [Aldersonia sp. NBC_00410]
MASVKTPRRYDSTRRRELASQGRELILREARRMFLAEGYAATTIGSIAAASGVSVETVYKSFGNKTGLLRAMAEEAMAGPGPIPTMRRSDEMAARETDPHRIVRNWAQFASEVTPRIGPVILLIQSVVGTSPEIADLRAELDADRLARMAHQARFLQERGYLRPDVTEIEARDVMWAYTDPGLYEMLVLRQNWTLSRFERFLGDALAAALLSPK